MPRLSVVAVRLALAYLLIGTGIGAAILAAKGGALPLGSYRWLPVHEELVLVGWLVQLAMGVAYWILPRIDAERPRAWLAVTAVLLLNIGLGCVVVGAEWSVPAAVAAGRAMELVAVVAFAVHMGPRLRYGGLMKPLPPAPSVTSATATRTSLP